MFKKNRLTRVFAVIMSFMLMFSAFPVSANEAEVKITIIHTNDQHARLGAESYLSQMKNDLLENGENVLVISAGDVLHGQTIATISKGKTIVDIMNAAGYDILVPGNHDFNYGIDRLFELEEQMNYDLLAANVIGADDAQSFKPYVIKEMDGLKVGIFGLATPETATKTNPLNVAGYTFGNPVEYAKEIVALLEAEECNVIIAVTHLGVDEETAENERSTAIAELPGIDLVVDGHSHTVFEEGNVVGDSLLVQTGEYGNNIGVATLTVVDGKVASKTAKLIKTPTSDEETELTQDAKVLEIIDAANAENELITSVVVANTPVVLQGEREDARTKETNLSNLLTESMIYLTDADIAITNGGGIRASIDEGDITMGEVLTVLPFGNYIMTLELTGEDVLKAIEHGVNTYPEPAGHYAQFDGIYVVIDPSKEAGSRVLSATLADGSELDLEKVYTVATNDFMAVGGDNYTMLANGKNPMIYKGLDEALIDYLQTNPEIKETGKGTITYAETEEVPEVVDTPVEVPEVVDTPVIVPQVEVSTNTVKYVVKEGDVLWKIAREYGVTIDDIVNANNIKNRDLIYVGQILTIEVAAEDDAA